MNSVYEKGTQTPSRSGEVLAIFGGMVATMAIPLCSKGTESCVLLWLFYVYILGTYKDILQRYIKNI